MKTLLQINKIGDGTAVVHAHMVDNECILALGALAKAAKANINLMTILLSAAACILKDNPQLQEFFKEIIHDAPDVDAIAIQIDANNKVQS